MIAAGSLPVRRLARHPCIARQVGSSQLKRTGVLDNLKCELAVLKFPAVLPHIPLAVRIVEKIDSVPRDDKGAQAAPLDDFVINAVHTFIELEPPVAARRQVIRAAPADPPLRLGRVELAVSVVQGAALRGRERRGPGDRRPHDHLKPDVGRCGYRRLCRRRRYRRRRLLGLRVYQPGIWRGSS